MDFALSLIPLALIGVCIGIISGMLGIGGGTIMVPIFRLVLGVSPLVSTATSLFTIIPTSALGAVSHIRSKTCHIPLGIVLGIGGALTSPLGVWLSTVSPSWLVMVTAALIIGYSAVNMLVKALKMRTDAKRSPLAEAISEGGPLEIKAEPRSSQPQGADSGSPGRGLQEADVGSPCASRPQEIGARLSSKQVAIGLAIGACAGMVSGYIGVGGGFIMVPLMIAIVGISIKEASGTSLAAMIILAIPGTIHQGLLGNIDYLIGVATAIGSMPGAVIGAYLVRTISERTLRFIFGGFLIIAAGMLAFNEIYALG